MAAVLPASPIAGVAFKWRCYEESLGKDLGGGGGRRSAFCAPAFTRCVKRCGGSSRTTVDLSLDSPLSGGGAMNWRSLGPH